MEHNTDTVMTCNGCDSQEFSSLTYAGENFYRCFHCEAIDDYRMAPERLELEVPEIVWEPEMMTALRKPAANELHPVFAEIMSKFMKGAR